MEWINVKDQEAPKDGRPFLCYDPNQGDNFPDAGVYVVQWEPKRYLQEEGYVEAGGEGYFLWEPTHWMPLPKPPKDE
jgi:uncharacterized protein DUF551